jgi:hypothetical protein
MQHFPELANDADDAGYSPLSMAAGSGSRPTIDVLLAAGANPALRNDGGMTPADSAAVHGHQELAAYLRSKEPEGMLDVQRILQSRGYMIGKPDGTLNALTASALAMLNNYVLSNPSGREPWPSAKLWIRYARGPASETPEIWGVGLTLTDKGHNLIIGDIYSGTDQADAARNALQSCSAHWKNCRIALMIPPGGCAAYYTDNVKVIGWSAVETSRSAAETDALASCQKKTAGDPYYCHILRSVCSIPNGALP